MPLRTVRAAVCFETPHLPSPLRRGQGRLRFQQVDGATALVASGAVSPLQVLAPRRRGGSAWAVLVTLGGGLVAGDDIEIEVDVGAGATAILGTQAQTKVYRARGDVGSSQELHARVGAGGVLALLPDPVCPFEAARYAQRQRVDLEASASALLLDALVAGRVARGERWAFHRHRSTTEIRVGGRLVVGDALELAPHGPGELAARLGRFDALAVAIAVGPAFAALARGWADAAAECALVASAPLLAAASPVAGGALLRCAAESAGELALFLRRALAPAAAALSCDPLAHRW